MQEQRKNVLFTARRFEISKKNAAEIIRSHYPETNSTDVDRRGPSIDIDYIL